MRAKKNINFLFCIHITFLFFILSAFHSPCLSPHCLSISSFFLHRPFSPSLISQAQPPQNLFSIADLTSPAATDPSVSLCTHSFSIEKDQATSLASKSGGQYQLGLDSSVKTMKPCPLAQVSSAGTEMDRVLGMGFGLVVLIFLGFCFVLLHWFWWARRGCGCAVIFMGLTVVVVVCWWLNEIFFYYNVYIILLC